MPDKPQTPTLDDVAQAAGVSTATVSRCLNTPDRVVDKTRLKVLKAIEDLGYTPNFGARFMAAKRTMTIGAIVPTIENSIFARGLQAFQEELHGAGYTLLLASSGYEPDVEEDQIKALVARGADGILLIGHDRSLQIYNYLKTQNVPVVVAWTFDSASQHISVGFNNRTAMFALASQAFALGHRRVGVISGHQLHNDRVRQRVEGISDAAEAAGLDPNDLSIVETHYDMDGGAVGLDQLMNAREQPSVIFCTNDVLAVGAIKQAQARGLRVPEDVSITGFDDIELARIVEPALTTVHVPHREMGRKAARAIVGSLARQPSATSIELRTYVEFRESLAAPRS